MLAAIPPLEFSDDRRREDTRIAIEAFAASLPQEQSGNALASIIDPAQMGRVPPYAIEVAVSALAPRVTSKVAAEAVVRLHDDEGIATTELWSKTRALVAQVSHPEASSLFSSLGAWSDNSPPEYARVLARTLGDLASEVPEAQRRSALSSVTVNFERALANGYGGVVEFATAIDQLGATPDEAAKALALILKAARAERSRIADRNDYARALLPLAKDLDSETRRTTSPVLLSLLGWSPSAEEAAAWAAAWAAVVEKTPRDHFVETLVEALKYPASTGEAERVLLAALRDEITDAPGEEAGLLANLEWIETAFPLIDLDAPVSCPAPATSQPRQFCSE